MEHFSRTFEVRWADLDPNRHLRHSAYNDYAAQVRLLVLEQIGLSLDTFARYNFGPVLFREETRFLKEVGMRESITVNAQLLKARKNGSRWSVFHEFYKSNGDKAATLTVDGAWMDLQKRKLTALPEEFIEPFLNLPRADAFILE